MIKKPRTQAQRLPDNIRLALRRYYPSEVSAHTAHYYTLPEHLALLRLRSEAQSRMLRWGDVAEDLGKVLGDLPLRVTEGTAFNNSYELEVLLHENLPFPDADEELFEHIKKGPVRTLRVAASFLIPYWTPLFLVRRKIRGGKISMQPVSQQGRHSTRAINAANAVLKRHGWKRIPANLAQTKIPNMDLKYVELGEVRVSDVVFGDITASLL